MIRTLAFNPYIAIIFAMLGQTLLMIWQILRMSKRELLEGLKIRDNGIITKQLEKGVTNSDEKNNSKNSMKQKAPIARGMINIINVIKELLAYIFDGLFVIITLITLDTALMWIFQAWTWADWAFQIPTVILLIIFDVQMLLRLVIYKRSIIDITSFMISAGIFEYVLRIYIVQFEVMGPYLEKALLIIFPAIIGITLIFRIISFVGMKLTSNNRRDNGNFIYKIFRERGIGKKMDELINHKLNIWFNSILWALILFQMMLIFNGYSLFTFIQFFF